MFNIRGPMPTLRKIVRKRRIVKKVRKTALGSLSDIHKDEEVEELLKALLDYMDIILSVDSDYRRNIEEFQGTYFFKTKNGKATVLAQFENGEMRAMKNVPEEDSTRADIVVTFKTGKAFMDFLLAPFKGILKDLFDEKIGVDRPHTFDIMESLRRNEVNVTGNLNYLYKFAFMANHLLLDAEKILGLSK